MKNIEMIIFDLDGTLWETTDMTQESIKEILKEENINYEVSKETVIQTMGCTYEKSAENYFPDFEESKRLELLDKIVKRNSEKLASKGGKVYPNLENVLIELKAKYKLAIVSNCLDGYIEAFLNSSKLEKYFDDYLPAGKYRMIKGEAIRTVMEKNNIQNAIYVGDTDKDYEASKIAEIPFVYAKYGFGKDLEVECFIEDISELPEVLKK